MLAIEASVRPELWEDLCNLIAKYFSATAFMVFEFDFESFQAPKVHVSTQFGASGKPLIEATMSGAPSEEMEAYALLAKAPPGRLVSELELYNVAHDGDLPANPFRDRVLAAGGSKSRHVARMNDNGPCADIAALHLPVLGADIPEQTRNDMSTLIPVLGKSLEAGRVVRALALGYGALLDVFDALDFPAAICEQDRHILISNSAFRICARDRDAISDQGGILNTVFKSDQDALHSVIADAQRPNATAGSLIATLRRRSGHRPLIVKTAPIRNPGSRDKYLTLVLILDPEGKRSLNAAGLSAFGLLSPAELDVCHMLVQGLSAREIAARRSTSVETARSQIKSATSKLACKSRLDLVRLAIATHFPLKTDAGTS